MTGTSQRYSSRQHYSDTSTQLLWQRPAPLSFSKVRPRQTAFNVASYLNAALVSRPALRSSSSNVGSERGSLARGSRLTRHVDALAINDRRHLHVLERPLLL